jgi:hypothetical protein
MGQPQNYGSMVVPVFQLPRSVLHCKAVTAGAQRSRSDVFPGPGMLPVFTGDGWKVERLESVSCVSVAALCGGMVVLWPVVIVLLLTALQCAGLCGDEGERERCSDRFGRPGA